MFDCPCVLSQWAMHVLCPDGLGCGGNAFHLAWGKAETTEDTRSRQNRRTLFSHWEVYITKGSYWLSTSRSNTVKGPMGEEGAWSSRWIVKLGKGKAGKKIITKVVNRTCLPALVVSLHPSVYVETHNWLSQDDLSVTTHMASI